MWSEVTQLCPTLCDPTDCSLPGSSIHGILQARILEWVAISFSRRSSRPRDWTRVSRIVGRRFTVWASREAQYWSCVLPVPCDENGNLTSVSSSQNPTIIRKTLEESKLSESLQNSLISTPQNCHQSFSRSSKTKKIWEPS